MEEQSESTLDGDRVTTRVWELDLSLAGKVYSPKKWPTKRRRQQIAQFLGREGPVERFAVRQTMPHHGYATHSPPSQAQYGAVTDFFVECCETQHQAKTLLSARDYASAVIHDAAFAAPRRRFLWLCATAFILADKDLRSQVRAWSRASYFEDAHIAAGIVHRKPYKIVSKFTARLIDDMRAQGAQIFG